MRLLGCKKQEVQDAGPLLDGHLSADVMDNFGFIHVITLVLFRMDQNCRVSRLISMMEAPSVTTWLDVASLIEKADIDLDTFNNAARECVSRLGSVQAVLNQKTHPILSNDHGIVSFVKQNLTKKHKVNCLGSALVAYLLCVANDISCRVYSSETHTWVATLPISTDASSTIIDVQDNLKAAKKSSLPLSIYANPQRLDDFAMCMIIIANDNDLEEEEEYTILRHYHSQLRHSWEISKLFTLELTLKKPGVSLAVLNHDHSCFEFAIQRVIYHIDHEKDALRAMEYMNILLERGTELCGMYSVNADLWMLSEGGFLHIAEEFTKAFHDKEDMQLSYERWATGTCDLARVHCGSIYDKYRKALPTMTRKRRRQRIGELDD